MARSRHGVRFAGESHSYRAARDALLDAEIDLLRAHVPENPPTRRAE